METVSLEKIARIDNNIQEIDKNTTIYLPENATLRDRYKIINVLGIGGFGITYKAYDKLLAAHVAIKEYYPMGIANRTPDRTDITLYTETQRVEFGYGKVRFLKEAQDLAKFNKNNGIVSVYDFFEENGTAYMVMEYLEGCTLKEYMANSSKNIDDEMMIQVTFSVMEALEEIHKAGLVHRDVSPDNIFICDDSCVKLIDFGAAKQDMKGDAKTVSVVLKYGYAPIEQYAKKSELGPWTDIYALGATMYKMVTGENPDEAASRVLNDTMKQPNEINTNVSGYINDVIVKAMAVRYADRFSSIKEMREALLNQDDNTSDVKAVSKTKISNNVNGQINESIFQENDVANNKVLFADKTPEKKVAEIKQVLEKNNAKNANKKWIIVIAGLLCIVVIVALISGINKKDKETENTTQLTTENTTQSTTEKTTQATTEKTTEATTENPVESKIIEEEINGYEVIYDESIGAITSVSTYSRNDEQLVIVDSVKLVEEDNKIKVYYYYHLNTEDELWGYDAPLYRYTGEGANRKSVSEYEYDVYGSYYILSMSKGLGKGRYEFEPGIHFSNGKFLRCYIMFEIY